MRWKALLTPVLVSALAGLFVAAAFPPGAAPRRASALAVATKPGDSTAGDTILLIESKQPPAYF